MRSPALAPPAVASRVAALRAAFRARRAPQSVLWREHTPAAPPPGWTLPGRADQALELAAGQTFTASVTLEAATSAPALQAGGVLMHPGALEGADLLRVVRPEAVEDLVYFPEGVPGQSLTYRLELGAGVAGLRLVERQIELLDAAGAPRLRLTAPWVIDAQGQVEQGRTELSGCGHDTSPAAPWGRAVTPPGAARCWVTLSWATRARPLLLDPSWSPTGSLAGDRSEHAAVELASGRVLVVGGISSTLGPLATAELYDPLTGTWAATGSMSAPVYGHQATRFADGRVLAVDALYSEATGQWTPTPPPAVRRTYGSVTVLMDGRALVTGAGSDTAELFDPTVGAAGSWSAAGQLSAPRCSPAAARLQDGRVIIIGGSTNCDWWFNGAIAAVDLYDPTSGTWTTGPSLPVPRGRPGVATLPDGRVLVAGGAAGGSDALDTTVHYNPTTNSWSAGPMMPSPRQAFDLVRLYNGRWLALGGRTSIWVVAQTADVFDPTTGAWSATVPPAVSPLHGSATALTVNKKVLVAGGYTRVSPQYPTEAAALYSATPVGDPCALAAECESAACVDGVCCDRACDGPCEACSTATKGSGADGVCAPVANGTDPHGDCDDSGSPTCTLDGTCDGAGACRRYSGSPCAAAPCGSDADCASGHCTEGICCDQACAEPCRSCRGVRTGTGIDGVCADVPAGTNPKGACLPGGTACGADGLCGAGGLCRPFAPLGTACGPTRCETDTETTSRCDGAGTCVQSAAGCAPYRCADATSCEDACATDAACLATAWCRVGDATCQPDQPLGAPCATGSQCASSHCVDGVCCDTACSGTCQACRAALKGQGSDGTCEDVTAGSDPDGECPDDGPASCDRDGTCSGAGACRLYAPTTQCGATACQGDRIVGRLCDGFGACADQPGGISCGAYRCVGNACADPCRSSGDCSPGHFCSAGACVPLRAQGTACAAASECASAFCVDGVCCDSACTGVCQSCRASAQAPGADGGVRADGTCAFALNGTDPHDDCADDGAPSCDRDGTCDGAGQCATYAAGTACSATACETSTNRQLGFACDGAGSCLADRVVDCGLHRCMGSACSSACTTDADCTADAFCEVDGSCQARLPAAAACTDSRRCASGFCVDGVCCDEACSGQCQACDVGGALGKCSPVLGPPRGARPPCAGPTGGTPDGRCQARLCDGTRDIATCVGFVGSEVGCRDQVCADGVQSFSAACDGRGHCGDPEGGTIVKRCAPYACADALECADQCTTEAECAPGHRCTAGQCVNATTCDGDHTLTAPTGATTDCAPFRCTQAGDCVERCTTTDDCVAGYVCNFDRVCVIPAGPARAEEGGCSCRVPRAATAHHPAWLAAVSILLALRRRRAQR